MEVAKKFKLTFVGAESVGKTSIISRYYQNTFNEQVDKTVGIDFMSITVPEVNIRLQMWDTAGQERFRSLIPSYLRDSFLVILVFSLTDRKSFEELDDWINKISTCNNSEAEVLLIGNKSDLPQREVKTEEGENFAQTHKMMYLEYSAKEGSKEELHAKMMEIINKALLNK